ncbi:AraC family transcriptional regulator [Paenibacillus selenitireducens]|uniref:AraC family transcriptional regulator n=2 Tax=Paenibacillus selenitireducens TaxID=1324314 RepID=A0A1T2XNR6_9BACL|nr:AraC family transcriptional regulator [Paenibacillus selenitireducens]
MLKHHQSIKSDTIHLPPSFPIRITETSGVSPSFQRLHLHVEMEINLIVKGTGYYIINGNKYPFRQGDIILINSNELHRAFETEDLIMMVIMFDPGWLAVEQRYDAELLAPFRKVGERFSNLLDANHEAITTLQNILNDMKREFDQASDSYVSVIRAQLIRFLAYINRYFKLPGAPRHQAKLQGIETIREVVQHMEEHVTEAWTLQNLANLAHLSPSRFSYLFSQIVGTSPMDYLIQLRLSHAVHLLETTEMKIIEVSTICGFRNLSNFNRLFRLYIGKSPSELRK